MDWSNSKVMMLIGLNPSPPDEHNDDPTIRRCIRFAMGLGYGSLCMMNLFAYRATDPEEMKNQDDPVGINNDSWLRTVADAADVIVAAWGIHGAYMGRGAIVKSILPPMKCFGLTKEGHPKHPLYLPSNSMLIEF
jgi:hypothetical protein